MDVGQDYVVLLTFRKILQGQCLEVRLALDRVQGGIVDRYLDGIGVAINPFDGFNAKKAGRQGEDAGPASNVQAIRDLVRPIGKYRNQCLQAKAGGFMVARSESHSRVQIEGMVIFRNQITFLFPDRHPMDVAMSPRLALRSRRNLPASPFRQGGLPPGSSCSEPVRRGRPQARRPCPPRWGGWP